MTKIIPFPAKPRRRDQVIHEVVEFLCGDAHGLPHNDILREVASKWPDITFAEYESAFAIVVARLSSQNRGGT